MHERFPRTFHWFVRARLLDEPAHAIAADEQVSSGRVRNELALIDRSMRPILQAMGVVVAVAAMVILWIRTQPPEDHELETSPPPPLEEPVAPTPSAAPAPEPVPPLVRAAALREAAHTDCGAARWRLCLDELDQAKALDPQGDDVAAVQTLRRRATNAEKRSR
jgi:hypothetical protein